MTRYSERTGLPQTYQVGPFDSTHLYVQWGGKLPGAETWSCGFRLWKSGGSAVGDAAPILANVAAAISAFHTRNESQISPRAIFQWVKVNAIGLDGHYLDDGTNEATFADTPGTGTGAAVYPNQVTMAVSLTTGFNRGPAHRGRFFLPLPMAPVQTDGRILPDHADVVRDSCLTFRTAVNAAAGSHVMVVMSRKAGAPGHRAVTGIQIGTVLDTQRRRRRQLAENYQ